MCPRGCPGMVHRHGCYERYADPEETLEEREHSALSLSSLRPDLLGAATASIALSADSRRAAASGFRPAGGDPNPRSGPSAPRRGGGLPPTSVECLDRASNDPQRRLRTTGFEARFPMAPRSGQACVSHLTRCQRCSVFFPNTTAFRSWATTAACDRLRELSVGPQGVIDPTKPCF